MVTTSAQAFGMLSDLISRDAIDSGLPNPRGNQLANLSIIFGIISTLLVIARIITRITISKRTGPDDYCIIAASLMAIAMTVVYCEEAHYGFGLHDNQVSYAHKVTALKWFFAAQLLYKVAICMVKISILLLYLRIFTARTFRIGAWVVMAVTVAYSTAAVLMTLFSCRPIQKSWDKKVPGQCYITTAVMWYTTSALAIVTDIAIIALPINEIRRLQLPRVQKLMLMFMFSLGLFVIACTVVRMIVVGPATTAVDTLYHQSVSNSWTFLEVNVGIICACLPTFKAPIVKYFPRLISNKTSSSRNRSRDPKRPGMPGFGSSTRSHLPTIGRPELMKSASDEEIMLDTAGIKKTTKVVVSSREVDPTPHALSGDPWETKWH